MFYFVALSEAGAVRVTNYTLNQASALTFGQPLSGRCWFLLLSSLKLFNFVSPQQFSSFVFISLCFFSICLISSNEKLGRKLVIRIAF